MLERCGDGAPATASKFLFLRLFSRLGTGLRVTIRAARGLLLQFVEFSSALLRDLVSPSMLLKPSAAHT
jgi:hypothetical protein